MSKEMSVIALGVWVVVLSQLGIPRSPWLTLLLVLTGLAIAWVGFSLRGEALSRGSRPHDRTDRTFVENLPALPTGQAGGRQALPDIQSHEHRHEHTQ